MGADPVRVYRRPVVALLMTGDELVMPGEAPGPEQVVASNAFGLKAMLEAVGAEVRILPIARDTVESLDLGFSLASGADLLVTIGGASVGDHDLVKPALEAAGAEIDFWKVAIRPGKPLLAGRLGHALVVGLPGNPVSAFVCARLFLWPLLRRMAGDPVPAEVPVHAITRHDLPANGPRRHFIRARLEGGEVTPFSEQDSSLFSVLVQANALLVRPENAPPAPAGTTVPVLTL